MVNNEGIESWLEAVYLGEPVTDKTGKSDIQVNPKTPKYVVGKVVIINRPDYPTEDLDILKENRNTIISRVRLPIMTGILFQPYIMRVDFRIIWNGDTITCPPDLAQDREALGAWLMESIGVTSTDTPAEISFPKILGCKRCLLTDQSGNLTALGWGLHQVGVNVKEDTRFLDLDLLKTKKILLE